MACDGMRVLLIDNYDSYTYNLCHRLLCAHPSVAEVEVVRNDAVAWTDLLPRLVGFDAVVLSPGPGVPSNPADFGLCADVLKWATAPDATTPPMPVLGVCLGHQGLAWVLGGQVVRAPRVAHGVVEAIAHCGTGIFEGLPETTTPVVRYHSWVVDEATLPPCLVATAWTRPGTTPMTVQNTDDIAKEAQPLEHQSRLIMAIAHLTLPVFGVQFHPESVCARDGDAMLANFARIAQAIGRRRRCFDGGNDHDHPQVGRVFTRAVDLVAGPTPKDAVNALSMPMEPPLPKRVRWRRLPDGCFPDDPVAAFCVLVGDAPRRFWLDSSRCDSPDDGRFSYMGACAARGLAAIACDLAAGCITEWHASMAGVQSHTAAIPDDGFMAYLERLLAARRCASDPALPGGLCGGGLVGYLGYEMRRECGSSGADDKVAAATAVPSARPGEPDAAFLVVDRYVVLDHLEKTVYAVALVDADDCHCHPRGGPGVSDGDDGAADDPETWFDHAQAAFTAAKQISIQSRPCDVQGAFFVLDRARDAYAADIEACLGEITDGESYELCLTNKARGGAGTIPDPWAYYVRLRAASPAPYAAFVALGPGLPTIASSSPEKFLSVDRAGRARSKPIKGTARRGATPSEDAALAAELAACPKTFAENLMIVDLVRNDLSVCCAPGSVVVPPGRLMAIETYAAVHQMVTTVDALLDRHRTALDLVRAAFPPGSMTGAPKARSMDILDRLEEHRPRGIYSGALGFFSADGACSLSVVIRTAVIDADGAASVGCGGAIVADSDPDAEFAEILLKADRLVRAAGGRLLSDGTNAVAPSATSDTSPDRILIETMQFDPTCVLFDRHVARITRSAIVLGCRGVIGANGVGEAVTKVAREIADVAHGPVRLRVAVNLDTGHVSQTTSPLPSVPWWGTPADALKAGVGDRVARVALDCPVNADDLRLLHKTLDRAIYERAHARAWSASDGDVPADSRETILVNTRGQLTEATRASIALLVDDGHVPVTPHLACGLLPGVMRAHLLANGLIREGDLTLDDLADAAAAGKPLLVFNAVRGVYAVRIQL
ncbi:Para-aminobenzoate synthetase [Pandoravirus salinus]|uniref:aminodeoxychorismate synthase n=1 Tax=Pandoravirus salinus TaxID=1349410 RepID=S4VT78_9VIRU|nr:glutamine amidotransferase [Pandoravirus salinus]AGO83483.1 Para-aminobenzoate synthetase [Pandoravirus salinus]